MIEPRRWTWAEFFRWDGKTFKTLIDNGHYIVIHDDVDVKLTKMIYVTEFRFNGRYKGTGLPWSVAVRFHEIELEHWHDKFKLNKGIPFVYVKDAPWAHEDPAAVVRGLPRMR